MNLTRPAFLLVALVLAASGCGAPTDQTGGPSRGSYEGPLWVTDEEAEHPRAGAAGNVVKCRTWGRGGSSDAEVYGDGATAGSPEAALDVAWGEGGYGGAREGLRIAKEEQDRVLFVLEVDGPGGPQVKQAVIVRDGPATEGAGGPGWYVESWAHCDYSELPRSFTDSIGLQVWNDSAGDPAPTTTIESWIGPEHCDWQSMTFLYLRGAAYVRAPLPDLAEHFAEPYRSHAKLPSDAVATEFRRAGARLWLSRDEQLAFVGSRDDVEAWPRTANPLGCE